MVLTTVNGGFATGLARVPFVDPAGYVQKALGGPRVTRGTVAPEGAMYGAQMRYAAKVPRLANTDAGAPAGMRQGWAAQRLTGAAAAAGASDFSSGFGAGAGARQTPLVAAGGTVTGPTATFAGQTAQIGANVRWADLAPAMEAADFIK